MFHYDVYTKEEAEAERYQLLKEGLYDAVITASEDRQSKTGNAMMDMTITVYDESGRSHDVRDFLVFTKPMMWKVIKCAESCGLLKEYEEGKLCSQIVINKNISVKIGIESGNDIPEDKLNGKALGAKYPDKNKVVDYILVGANGVPKSFNEPPPITDDDIPF